MFFGFCYIKSSFFFFIIIIYLLDILMLNRIDFCFSEIDQNKDRMLEVLEGKGLSFLFPLLKLEKELLKQIKADPSPQTIYKWIKDNISLKLHTDKGFVNILMTRYSPLYLHIYKCRYMQIRFCY